MRVNGEKLAVFDYLYFFYMVILMSYLVPETRVFNGGFVSRPLAFAIPFILTVFMYFRHRVRLSNRVVLFMAMFSGWSIIQIVTKNEYDAKSISMYVAILYVFFSSYVHVNVFKERLFDLYESVMVVICKIALPLWVVSNVFPSTFASLFRLLPKTGYGNHLLYLYNWMDPSLGQVEGVLLRNAGCSWEPGRFAIMICLAIFINLSNNGVHLKGNRKLIWLLIALATTFSTTGYIIVLVLFVLFYVRKLDLKYILGGVLLVALFSVASYNLSFLSEKIKQNMNMNEMVGHVEDTWQWTERNAKGERAYAMDRLPSAFYEWLNFRHDPIIGYGCVRSKSFFSQNYTESIDFTGGLVTNFSKYGIVMGMLFFYCLWRSSKRISMMFHQPHSYILMVLYLLMLFSYPLMEFAIFCAIWFYDLMLNDYYLYDNNSDSSNCIQS